MPFGCFKKEKAAKTKTKGKKGGDEPAQGQNEAVAELNAVPTQPPANASADANFRSPRGDRTPKTPKIVEEAATATTKDDSEALKTSTGETPRASSKKAKTPRSRANTGPKSPRTKGASSPVSDLPLATIIASTPKKEGLDDFNFRPASARVNPTTHAPDSTPATPHFFSPRVVARRGSAFSRVSMSSRGRASSISMNDWSKIQNQTDSAMAVERKRIFERKKTLAANVEASLTALKQQEEAAKRQSTELGLDDLDDLELEGDEVALAKFKEEDFDEEVMEEKLFEKHIVAHLEEDVQETKRALQALNDNSSSMDLDDLEDLDGALNLDDSQDLDGLEVMDSGSDDEALPSYSRPIETQMSSSSPSDTESPISPSNTFDEPSNTEETHTERQNSDGDLSISNSITPRRHKAQLSEDPPLSSLTVDPVA